MGLLDFLLGPRTPEARLARARERLAADRPADARLDALDAGDVPGAHEVLAEAEAVLARRNLEAAVSWAEADDVERVEHHLQVARTFHSPALDEEFAEARARIRELAQTRAARSKVRAQREDERLAEVQDGFLASRDAQLMPLPEGTTEAEAEALEARLAILLDGYPDDLRDQLVDLGPAFAQAILQVEDGQAEEALPVLLGMPDDLPAVLHERARAARALGDPVAAARAWRAFAEAHGKHATIGDVHTAVRLAESLAAAGDPEAGLQVLRQGRKEEPDLGGGLWASLLEATGRLPEAEKAYRGLLAKHGSQPSIYLGIARVRLQGGHRDAAMRALETSLSQNDCEPGRCGYRPPDLATHRLLAILYLEDGKDRVRGLELADTAQELAKQPTWEDAYLATLAARARGESDWRERVDHLTTSLADGDPRRARVATHLAPA